MSTVALGEKAKNTAILFASLFLFWLMLVNSFTFDTIILGVFASLVIALAYRDGLSFFTEFRWTPQALLAGVRYFALFFRQLVYANLRLAAIVVDPKLPIEPGIVKIRTGLKSHMGRLMLANSITLTPGTLTVEVEGEWLYVHVVTVHADDIEGATREISADFEQPLELMYG